MLYDDLNPNQDPAPVDPATLARRADRARFAGDPDLLAFQRPYLPGESVLDFPAGTTVIVSKLSADGKPRRIACPPRKTGLGHIRLD